MIFKNTALFIMCLFLFFSCAQAKTAKISAYPDIAESKKALNYYGMVIQKGNASKSDEEYLLKMAENGNPAAGFIMGEIYEERKDYKTAKKWYRQAADIGFGPAQYRFALLSGNTQSKAYETIAYLMLASRSIIPEVYESSQKMLSGIENRVGKSTYKKALKYAQKTESAYKPEFAAEAEKTELEYMVSKANMILNSLR